MNFRQLVSVLLRRWYVVLAGLLITAGLSAWTISLVPATYTATSSLLLLPPKSVVGERGNPYLNLSGLAPAMDVLTSRVMAGPVVAELAARHPGAEFAIARDTTTAGSILVITATATTPQETLEIRDVLSDAAGPTLSELQELLGVPTTARITLTALAAEGEPRADVKNQLRALIVVAGGSLTMTLLGAALLDGVLARGRWRRFTLRRAGSAGNAPHPVPDEEAGDDQPAPNEEPRQREDERSDALGGTTDSASSADSGTETDFQTPLRDPSNHVQRALK